MKKLLQILCITLSLGLATSAFSQLSKEKLIIGTWQLIYKSGGLTGKIIYSDSIMKRKKIEFTSDSIYREFHRDSLIYESKYHFGKTQSKYALDLIIIKGHRQKLLKRLSFSQRQVFSIRNGLLSLSREKCHDCFKSNYRRVFPPRPIKRKQLKNSNKTTNKIKN